MLNVHTIFTMKNSENEGNGEDKTDATSTSNNDNKNDELRSMDRWKKNCVLPKLDKNGVCTLFETFLTHVSKEDYVECINAFRKHKISGKTLVEASENEELLEKMEKALKLPYEYQAAFDKMIDFIRQRQKERNREMGKDDESSEKLQTRQQSKKRKLPTSSNANTTTGATVKQTKNSTGRFKKIKVDRNETATGDVTGLAVDATDNSQVDLEEVTVTVGFPHSQNEEES